MVLEELILWTLLYQPSEIWEMKWNMGNAAFWCFQTSCSAPGHSSLIFWLPKAGIVRSKMFLCSYSKEKTQVHSHGWAGVIKGLMHNFEEGCYVITPVRHWKLLRERGLRSLIDPSCWCGNSSRVPGSWHTLLIKSRAVWGAEMLHLSTKEQPCVLNKGVYDNAVSWAEMSSLCLPSVPSGSLASKFSLRMMLNSNSSQNAAVFLE